MNPGQQRPLLRDPRLYVVFGVTLMGVMGVASLTPAFPAIVRALDISSRQTGLLISAFTFPGIFLAPILGFLSDRLGRKVILVPALRFLQGTGAASLTSLSVTLLGDLYEGGRRKTAVGYNAGALSIGTAAYPVIGGLLATISWQAPFFLPLLALPIGILVVAALGESSRGVEGRIRDHLRRILENARSQGILRLSLLAILLFVMLYGAYLAYLPFLLTDRTAASSAAVGAIMSGMSVATAITSSRYGRIARRHSLRAILTAAFGFYLVAFGILPFLHHWWSVALTVVVYGVGQGLAIPALQSEIAARASTELRGATMSVNTMAIRIGQTLGPLLTGWVYAQGGLSAVFFIAAGIAVLSQLAIIRVE